MSRPWFGASPVGRSLVLVAALAALIVASLAVATVGGFLTQPALVPPVTTCSPSTSPTSSPRPSPTASVETVDLDEFGGTGADATIEITDRSGRLVRAVSGAPRDGGSVAGGTVAVAAVDGDPSSVRLTWTGLPCQTLHRMSIEPDGVTMALFQPAFEGTFPRDLVLALTFDGPVDPTTLAFTSSVGE